MKKQIWLLVGAAATVALCAGAYAGISAAKLHSTTQQEITAQEAEKTQCRHQLQQLFDAWAQYRKDHKGQEPQSVEALSPKYLSSPSILVCPTAQRWLTQHKSVSQGSVKIGGVSCPATYGFQWLTAGAQRRSKLLGDKTPLITCESHEEGLYRAVFDKTAPVGAFDPEPRSHYPDVLQSARALAVRRDGVVEEVAPVAP